MTRSVSSQKSMSDVVTIGQFVDSLVQYFPSRFLCSVRRAAGTAFDSLRANSRSPPVTSRSMRERRSMGQVSRLSHSSPIAQRSAESFPLSMPHSKSS